MLIASHDISTSLIIDAHVFLNSHVNNDFECIR